MKVGSKILRFELFLYSLFCYVLCDSRLFQVFATCFPKLDTSDFCSFNFVGENDLKDGYDIILKLMTDTRFIEIIVLFSIGCIFFSIWIVYSNIFY